jgi:hypothetical protein
LILDRGGKVFVSVTGVTVTISDVGVTVTVILTGGKFFESGGKFKEDRGGKLVFVSAFFSGAFASEIGGSGDLIDKGGKDTFVSSFFSDTFASEIEGSGDLIESGGRVDFSSEIGGSGDVIERGGRVDLDGEDAGIVGRGVAEIGGKAVNGGSVDLVPDTGDFSGLGDIGINGAEFIQVFNI